MVLVDDGQADVAVQVPLEQRRRAGGERARGEMYNLIFAADGPKPRIVLSDVINNDLKVVGTPNTAWSTTGR